jgi:hypothetical protein
LFQVTKNRPPTPPSLSAALQNEREGAHRNAGYLRNIKSLMTNRAFIVSFLFIGGAMGYVSTLSTKIEQESFSYV